MARSNLMRVRRDYYALLAMTAGEPIDAGGFVAAVMVLAQPYGKFAKTNHLIREGTGVEFTMRKPNGRGL